MTPVITPPAMSPHSVNSTYFAAVGTLRQKPA